MASQLNKFDMDLVRSKTIGQWMPNVCFLHRFQGKATTKTLTKGRHKPSNKLEQVVAIADKDSMKQLDMNVMEPALQVHADGHIG